MIKSIEQLIDVGNYIRVALNLAHFYPGDNGVCKLRVLEMKEDHI